MPLLLLILIAFLLIAPQLYVRFTLSRYDKQDESLPGTGGELAQHLITRFELDNIKVEETPENTDHYAPQTQTVALSPSVLNGKSLKAVAIATHEVGHAIQYAKQENIVKLRERFIPLAQLSERIGQWFFTLSPLFLLIFKVPHAMLLSMVIGILIMLISALMQLIILPMEWDASFRKALPILVDGEYIKPEDIPSIKKILRAAALTYLASALMSVLNIWRFWRLIR